MEPRVRFCDRFGCSDAILFGTFLSNSFGVCGRVLVLVLCGVEAFTAAIHMKLERETNEFYSDINGETESVVEKKVNKQNVTLIRVVYLWYLVPCCFRSFFSLRFRPIFYLSAR